MKNKALNLCKHASYLAKGAFTEDFQTLVHMSVVQIFYRCVYFKGFHTMKRH